MPVEKYGFVYLWYDTKYKRYYVGCRWGSIDDGYVCSSDWMKKSYDNRPSDFRRRVLRSNITTRQETYEEEQKWLNMIKESEIKPNTQSPRYYNMNIVNNKVWHTYDENVKSIGQKISAAKKGKKNGPMTEERKRAISEAKKKAFAERGGMSEEHKQKLRAAKLGTQRSEEAKQKTSETMKDKWQDADWATTQSEHLKKAWKRRKA